jgi:hypothetical protein
LQQIHLLLASQSSSICAFWQHFALAQSQLVIQSQNQTAVPGEVANGSEDFDQRLSNEPIACAD